MTLNIKNKIFFMRITGPLVERMLDCQRIYDYLILNGWKPTKNVKKASIVILCTCAYSATEEEYSNILLKKYDNTRYKYSAMFVVGILPGIKPEIVQNHKNCIFINPNKLDKFDEVLSSEIQINSVAEPNKICKKSIKFNDLEKKLILLKSRFYKQKGNIFSNISSILKNYIFRLSVSKAYINPRISIYNKNYFYLRISSGCVGNCTCCPIKLGTGNLISRPINTIISEFKDGLRTGHKVFVITADDTGCYGIDKELTIIDLLNSILVEGSSHNYKLVVINYNARWLVKYYAQLKMFVKIMGNKLFYLHIPIQSGSNTILKNMNRHYSIEDIVRCLKGLINDSPKLAIATDVLVGFPGELQEDHEATLHLIKQINFCFVDVYGYEDRLNLITDNGVEQSLIQKRRHEILNIQKKRVSGNVFLKKGLELLQEVFA
ncbi:MAG: radical SAM protein [Candidatus Omnitrophica bacterium]|nr:radical SAM protein [Candidatus Omnitrophota bacterium]